MTRVLMRILPYEDRDTERTPGAVGGQYQSDTLTSQKMPRTVAHHQKLGERYMGEILPQSLPTIYSTLILSSTPIRLPFIFLWLPNFCLQSVLFCRPTCSTNYLISPLRSFKVILNSTNPKTEVTIPLNQALL